MGKMEGVIALKEYITTLSKWRCRVSFLLGYNSAIMNRIILILPRKKTSKIFLFTLLILYIFVIPAKADFLELKLRKYYQGVAIEGIYHHTSEYVFNILIEGTIRDIDGDIIGKKRILIKTSYGSYYPFVITFEAVKIDIVHKYSVEVIDVK